MQHLIRKQIIDLRLSKKLDAFRMQHLVSTHYTNKILPVLEKLFDELSDGDEVIRLDRLEIDLGTLYETGIVNDKWNESYLTEIISQLREQITARFPGKTITREPEILSICRQWLYYMQHGRLPWNALQTGETWYWRVLEALATDFNSAAGLRLIIRQNPLAAIRIIEQHSESFLVKLIEILTAEKQNELPEAFNEMYELFIFSGGGDDRKRSISEKNLRKKLWLRVLMIAAHAEKNQVTSKLSEKIIPSLLTGDFTIKKIPHNLKTKLKIILPALKLIEEKAGITRKDKPGKKAAPGGIIKDKEQGKKGETEITSGRTDPGKKAIKNDDPGTDKHRNHLIDEPGILTGVDARELLTSDGEEIEEEGIFVQLAGLVLLHPFLYSLFKRLQLAAEEKIIHLQAQQKAIYLLYYAATGNIQAEEHELVIPKILCNWPLQSPVEKEVELAGNELNEADHMLEAVIEQWEILKNTSPAGLREGFLQRNGILIMKNGSLNLQVESSSIDVLLDQLPWNLSMIKLPWRKDILRVEWR